MYDIYSVVGPISLFTFMSWCKNQKPWLERYLEGDIVGYRCKGCKIWLWKEDTKNYKIYKTIEQWKVRVIHQDGYGKSGEYRVTSLYNIIIIAG